MRLQANGPERQGALPQRLLELLPILDFGDTAGRRAGMYCGNWAVAIREAVTQTTATTSRFDARFMTLPATGSPCV